MINRKKGMSKISVILIIIIVIIVITIMIFVKNKNGGSTVNSPVLTEGMIPVKWDTSGKLVETTTNDSDWYNYASKQWANSVTKDAKGNITGYFVWIPRYEYQIPSPHSKTAQTINVDFVNGIRTTAKSGYKIHPAFTFGDKELEGIWVAKFEASGNENEITVLPDVVPVKKLTIDKTFTACLNMAANTSKYGWSTKDLDTHLIKNVEWGAVAYLSNSIYGKNSEIWINPDSNYYTGRCGDSVNASSTTTTYPYNNEKYGGQASTTGNFYGIYDMNGGTWEYTAAYVNNGDTYLKKYGYPLVNSDAKYKDVYEVSNDDTESGVYSANSSKVGDAVYETSDLGNGIGSWYADYSYMPNFVSPFFVRGGNYKGTTGAGIFSFWYSDSSYMLWMFSFRPVIVIGEGI